MEEVRQYVYQLNQEERQKALATGKWRCPVCEKEMLACLEAGGVALTNPEFYCPDCKVSVCLNPVGQKPIDPVAQFKP